MNTNEIDLADTSAVTINSTSILASRHHDFCVGHRVYGHESKCSHLHGHNYRVKFSVVSLNNLDKIGRVLDFSAIDKKLCQWIEQNWDHKFLVWEKDPVAKALLELDEEGTCLVPFNPTAENMGLYLINFVGPTFLPPETELRSVDIQETRKCSVTVTKTSSNIAAATDTSVYSPVLGSETTHGRRKYREVAKESGPTQKEMTWVW